MSLSSLHKTAKPEKSSFLEPFLDPLSELTGINMLWSQSVSRRNLPLPLACSSLWFIAWYSMSSMSPACPTVASKNSTKAWYNHFQMNDCMAAQCNADVPPSVVSEALWFGPLEGGKTGKDFPIGHQAIIIARWTWARASAGYAFIMSAGGHGSSTMHSSPH